LFHCFLSSFPIYISMLGFILIHFIASVWAANVVCDDMGPGDCSIPQGTEFVSLETMHRDYNHFAYGVPKSVDRMTCRDLCAAAGPKFGPGCCLHGAITRDMGLAGADNRHFMLNGRSSVVSCFYFKKADGNLDFDPWRSRSRDYRQVCVAPGSWKSCSKHSDCGGKTPLCKNGACMPCSQCHLCKQGADGTCGSTCQYAIFEGYCRGEASMQFSVNNEPIGTTDVVVYGFAAMGLGVLVFGAYKHYSGKAHEEQAQIL